MDRIINVRVSGNHLQKDGKNAGVKGEGNVTKLRITFDEGWDGYAKTVTFLDAHGKNPVKRIQGVDLIEDIITDARTYITPIPAEPLAIAGEMTFLIDGYSEGKRQRSVSAKLVVLDAPDTDNAGEPVDPTPTPEEQLQEQIDSIMREIQETAIVSEKADSVAEAVEEAKGYANDSLGHSGESRDYAVMAKSHADDAEECAIRAHNALGKISYIGDNGNWFAWDSANDAFYDTGVKAQSGSTVYYGENPPSEADVWIDPSGESGIYAPYIGENGNWYTFNAETQNFTDSGICATPTKGIDYWTEEDKAEINAYVDEQHKELWHDASFVAYECVNSTITPNAGPSGETKYIYSYDVTEFLKFVNGGCKVVFGGDTYEPRVTYNSQYTITALLMPRYGDWGVMVIENFLSPFTSKYGMTLTIEATQGYVPPEDLTLYIRPSGVPEMKIRAEAIPDYVSKTYVDNALSEVKSEIVNDVLDALPDGNEVGY